MTQARKMPEPVVSKVEVATVSIQTSPIKELKKEEAKRLSKPADVPKVRFNRQLIL